MKKGQIKKDLVPILKDLALPVVASGISLVPGVGPIIGIGITAAGGGWTVINEYRERRAREIIKSVGKEKLINLLNGDEKTKDILHKVLTNVFDESSLKRRELYYQYLKNVSNNIHPDFDYHTKLISVLNMITFEEINTLEIFSQKYGDILKYTGEKENKETPIMFHDERGVNVAECRDSSCFGNINEKILEKNLDKIGNNDLIFIGYGRMDGTFYGPLTDFGQIFLDFIKNG